MCEGGTSSDGGGELVVCVCVCYCSTYHKAVREGGGGMEDMCYERLRAEASVD
jgi:hypothetical protein